jgi:SAM-dependent methyltransferase
MNCRFAYLIGFHPWEDAAADPPFVAKAAEPFAREETGPSLPFGSALDLGTGSGIWGIELAKRGWQVTGVDFVKKALRRARAWSAEARRTRFRGARVRDAWSAHMASSGTSCHGRCSASQSCA